MSGWSLESVPDVQGLASYRPATLQTGSKQASRSAHSLTDSVTQFCYAMAYSPDKRIANNENKVSRRCSSLDYLESED